LKGAGRNTAKILLQQRLAIYYKNRLRMASVQGWTLIATVRASIHMWALNSYCESGYIGYGSNIYGNSGYPGLGCIVTVKVGIKVWALSLW